MTERKEGEFTKVERGFIALNAVTRTAIVAAVTDKEAPVALLQFLVNVLEGDTDLDVLFDDSRRLPVEVDLNNPVKDAVMEVSVALATLLAAMAEEQDDFDAKYDAE